MARYCHECGAELFDDTSKFCSKCGAKTVKEGDTVQRQTQQQSEPIQHNEEEKEESSHSVASGIFLIFIGFLVVLGIYLYPMASVAGKTLSLADLNNLCSNTLVSVLSGNNCSLYTALFYIGWIVVVIFVVYGLYEIIVTKD